MNWMDNRRRQRRATIASRRRSRHLSMTVASSTRTTMNNKRLASSLLLLSLVFFSTLTTDVVVAASSQPSSSPHHHHHQQHDDVQQRKKQLQQNSRFTFRLPGRSMDNHDDNDNDNEDSNHEGRPRTSFMGRGREFDIFDNRSPRTTAAARVQGQHQEHENDLQKSSEQQAHEKEDCDDDESLITPVSSSSSQSPFRNRRSFRHARFSGSDSTTDRSQSSSGPLGDDDVNKDDTVTSLVSDNNNNDPSRLHPPSTTPPLSGGPPPSLVGGSNSLGSGATNRPRFTSDFRQRQQQESSSNNYRSILQPVSNWWSTNISPNMQNWPKIKCRIEPTTTLKLRKTFRPLKTIVRLGADFNTQLGVWQFKSSWEDAIIGGKITLAGKELQISKSWQLSVGGGRMRMGGAGDASNLDDLITRLRFRAAVDLQTWKAYARVGFRTERLSPINVMEGFTLFQQVPLDGAQGHVKLEVKANFALPEPEIEYSTETQRSFVGAMGDIEIAIDEFNLLLDY